MNSIFLVFLFSFLSFIECSYSVEELKQLSHLNMTITHWYGESDAVIVNSVISPQWKGDGSFVVPASDDTAEFEFEIERLNGAQPSIEHISVSEAGNPKVNQNIIQPRVSLVYPKAMPNKAADDTAIYGMFLVHYLCFYGGEANVLITLFVKYPNEQVIMFTLSWAKQCADGPIPGLTIYHGGSTGKIVLQDGYVNSLFDQGSVLKEREKTGSFTYFTVVREGEYESVPIEWSFSLSNSNLTVTLSGDATEDPVPQKSWTVLEVMYEGKSSGETEVTVIGTMEIEGSIKSFTFSWNKFFTLGPAPGFDILTGSMFFSDNYAIISDGAVQPSYLQHQIILQPGDSCMNLYVRGRMGNVSYSAIEFTNSEGLLKIHSYGSGKKGPATRESKTLTVCHECIGNGDYTVTAEILGVSGLQMSSSFRYTKKCIVGKHLVDISTGMYVPHHPEFYAVRAGKTQSAFGFHSPEMRARWDEERTRFYLTSSTTFEMHQPTVEAMAEQNQIEPSVIVIGHDTSQELIPVDAEGPSKVIEVSYNCFQKNEFQIILHIKIGNNDGELVFSWMKECRPHSYSFSVGTSLDSQLALVNNDNVNPADLSLAKNVIEDGEVKAEYASDKPSEVIPRYLDESRFYIVARENRTLQIFRKPTLVVVNHDILTATLTGDILETKLLSTDPKEMLIQYKCKKTGLSQVDVNLYLGPVNQQYVPITFSFNKNCRDPSHWNWRIIKDAALIIGGVLILVLCYPYVAAFFPNNRCFRSGGFKKSKALEKDI